MVNQIISQYANELEEGHIDECLNTTQMIQIETFNELTHLGFTEEEASAAIAVDHTQHINKSNKVSTRMTIFCNSPTSFFVRSLLYVE